MGMVKEMSRLTKFQARAGAAWHLGLVLYDDIEPFVQGSKIALPLTMLFGS